MDNMNNGKQGLIAAALTKHGINPMSVATYAASLNGGSVDSIYQALINDDFQALSFVPEVAARAKAENPNLAKYVDHLGRTTNP